MISITLDNLDSLIGAELLADILSVSKATLSKWELNGKFKSTVDNQGSKKYRLGDFIHYSQIRKLLESKWDQECSVVPARSYNSVELFAGAGGLAIGLEKSGFNVIALNEIDKHACSTLQQNRKHWNVIEGDIRGISFEHLQNVDFVSGGFPCQTFSYAGKKMGFEDTRGTLFFEFARSIQEMRPSVFMGENVRGLLKHDNGKTLDTIKSVISELGYTLIPPRVLKAIFYQVPQKRERLILIGIRNDLLNYSNFSWPEPSNTIYVLKDALQADGLYDTDVPESAGQMYPDFKANVLSHVPQGGYWKDLPVNLQREYMQGSFQQEGGKTGMARRLSWDEPSLTLTCAPAQKQTERCHPIETRPLTVREYARIQTFPDDWQFSGSVSDQYKQIGNAVPVNLAHAIGRRLIDLLNQIEIKSIVSNKSIDFTESDRDQLTIAL